MGTDKFDTMGPSAATKKILREMFVLDVRALALFRIALGLLVLADLCTRSLLLAEHYTAAGVLPLTELGHEMPGPRPLFPYILFPHLWADTIAWQGALFLWHGLAALALIVGFRVRAALIMTWFLMVSLHARNPTLIYGADDLLRMMLLWSIFLPAGRCCSLDARIARGAARGSGANGDGPAPVRAHLSFPGGALLVQVFVMYFFTWLCKSGEDWFRGDAVYYALHLDVYARSTGHFMRAFPELLRPLSLGVFWFELAGPLLLFSPLATYRLRMIGLAGFLLMQIGFAVFLSLGLFPWIASAALIPFLRLPGFDAGSESLPTKLFYKLPALVVLFLFAHVLLVNTRLAPRVLPASVHDFMTFGIRLDQTWCMFAPRPGRKNEWDRFVIESTTGNRREVFPAVRAPGPDLLEVYDRAGGRRRDYFTELHDEKHQRLYAKFLCRKHAYDFPEGIEFVEIRLVSETIPPPHGPGRERVRDEDLLLRVRCPR